MKTKFVGLALLSAIVVTAPAMAGTAKAMKGAELAPMAKITLSVARATALKAHPGKITDQELEKEAGGTGLRYSFDIRSGGKTYEVGVDARTGAVLENKQEGKNPD